MPSSRSQRPAARSPAQRIRDQVASVTKHISFIDEPVVDVAPTETIEDDPTSQDIQPESPCITREDYVCHSSVELVPIQRFVHKHYEYQFVKPWDVAGMSNDGWEVWTPNTTSDESSDSTSDNDDAHDMTAVGCSCQPAAYRIRYRDVMYLRPDRCVSGWGDWNTYRPDQIVEGHEDTRDWHAPTKGPFMTILQDGTGRSAFDLFKVVNEQSRGLPTLREAVKFYQEQVQQEDWQEVEECDFCSGDRAGSGNVLFRV
ncbi:uncharacterized protein B0J16DRAFT_375770 [Fusarium flagelliforme]|uniref:Uncharacterized protein n=1 Tax=Fusarium flagelliforme TaxID=2675880 RepID=A0A395MG55_9HYPO|nr:uncharacterized protein B0J16DRAFT_375770 [Fusarium flagelliforme]KAH7175065.1 hypothetical protein B0J16DRAFT_375770 [Fusarium flagelliforme]RFN46898.1 hypothetical protein FIE12Z_8831 [Fusarium flagelliforme]